MTLVCEFRIICHTQWIWEGYSLWTYWIHRPKIKQYHLLQLDHFWNMEVQLQVRIRPKNAKRSWIPGLSFSETLTSNYLSSFLSYAANLQSDWELIINISNIYQKRSFVDKISKSKSSFQQVNKYRYVDDTDMRRWAIRDWFGRIHESLVRVMEYCTK